MRPERLVAHELGRSHEAEAALGVLVASPDGGVRPAWLGFRAPVRPTRSPSGAAAPRAVQGHSHLDWPYAARSCCCIPGTGVERGGWRGAGGVCFFPLDRACRCGQRRGVLDWWGGLTITEPPGRPGRCPGHPRPRCPPRPRPRRPGRSRRPPPACIGIIATNVLSSGFIALRPLCRNKNGHRSQGRWP
jgi:hypothetical protein